MLEPSLFAIKLYCTATGRVKYHVTHWGNVFHSLGDPSMPAFM